MTSRFNGVVFPIGIPRITMPFRSYDTKWYSPDKPHRGVDLAPFPGSEGQPIYAPCHGKIVHVGEHVYAGLQIIMAAQVPYRFGVLDLDYAYHQLEAGEQFFIRVTHNRVNLVREGDEVHTGQVIGHIGMTGKHVTGPHIHTEVRIRHPDWTQAMVVDPMDFFIASIVGLRDSLI